MSKFYKEFFFHFDISVIFCLITAGIIFIFLHPVSWFTLLAFAVSLVLFTFGEYMTHRFIFHMKPPKSAFLLKLIKRIHYDHHVYPNDLKLLFLPLWYSIPNMLIISSVFYLITRSLPLTVAFAVGLMCTLMVYEWKHYIAHRPIKPKTKFGKWLKKTHILHHFKNENYWYGVSNPVFDIVFGTSKDEKDVPTSETAKNLEKKGKEQKEASI
jgi:sterol desaturase/sphingolipid hydroxylase (fatty acid hydroxylase superfamily)